MRTLHATSTILAVAGLLLPWERGNVILWLYVAFIFSSPAIIPLISWIAYCIVSAIAMVRQTYNKGVWLRLVLLAIATIFFVQRPFSMEMTLNNSGYALTIAGYVLGVISGIVALGVELASKPIRNSYIPHHTWLNRRTLIALCLCLALSSGMWYFYRPPSFQNKCSYLLSAPQSPRMTPWPRTPTAPRTLALARFVSAKPPLTGARNPTCAFLELGETNPVQATARLRFRVITSMEWGDGEITWYLLRLE